MSDVLKYPVAEIFTSPQGEGTYTGTLMTFVRLAGCNVGKPYTVEAKNALNLQVYQERCTVWNGESFPCDTNYRKTELLSVTDILERLEAPRMILTGGEPLMHNVAPLIEAAWRAGKYVHIETSGTKPLPRLNAPFGPMWVAVSPKAGFRSDVIDQANELRFLVGPEFNEELFVAQFGFHFLGGEEYSCTTVENVFISPINDEHTFNEDNKQKCLALQRKYPHLRISTQTHKILGVR